MIPKVQFYKDNGWFYSITGLKDSQYGPTFKSGPFCCWVLARIHYNRFKANGYTEGK